MKNKWVRYKTYPQTKKIDSGEIGEGKYLEITQGDAERAKQLMIDTGADHVLYGIKRQRLIGEGIILDRYMQTMSHDTFLRYFGEPKQVLVLAVHNTGFQPNELPEESLPKDEDDKVFASLKNDTEEPTDNAEVSTEKKAEDSTVSLRPEIKNKKK